MNNQTDCMGNYDFDNIAYYARKCFIEGYSLLDLVLTAKSSRQRQEMTLVSYLEVENDHVENILLDCQYKEQCKETGCRQRLKKMIEQELLHSH